MVFTLAGVDVYSLTRTFCLLALALLQQAKGTKKVFLAIEALQRWVSILLDYINLSNIIIDYQLQLFFCDVSHKPYYLPSLFTLRSSHLTLDVSTCSELSATGTRKSSLPETGLLRTLRASPHQSLMPEVINARHTRDFATTRRFLRPDHHECNHGCPKSRKHSHAVTRTHA